MARREVREGRRAAGIEDPAPKTASRQAFEGRRVSWWGIAGGVWAVGTLVLAAVVYVITSNEDWEQNAVACGVGAVAFVPAVAFSIIPSSRREAVLRAETALALGFAFFGVFVVKDIGIPVLLAPPTLMLATAAGWTFPGGRTKKTEG